MEQKKKTQSFLLKEKRRKQSEKSDSLGDKDFKRNSKNRTFYKVAYGLACDMKKTKTIRFIKGMGQSGSDLYRDVFL